MCITVCSYKHRLQPELKFNVRIYLARPESHRVRVGSDTLLLQTSIIHFAAGASCHCYARKKTHTHNSCKSSFSAHSEELASLCEKVFWWVHLFYVSLVHDDDSVNKPYREDTLNHRFMISYTYSHAFTTIAFVDQINTCSIRALFTRVCDWQRHGARVGATFPPLLLSC